MAEPSAGGREARRDLSLHHVTPHNHTLTNCTFLSCTSHPEPIFPALSSPGQLKELDCVYSKRLSAVNTVIMSFMGKAA